MAIFVNNNVKMTELIVRMDVKDESNRIFTICHGCLSSDRKLKCITGQTKALFIKLREDVVQNENDTRGLLLCWECVALLNKMKYFQSRIKTAQYRLAQFLQNFYENKNKIPQTLSLLIKTKHNADKYNYTFEEERKELILEQNNFLDEQINEITDQKGLIFEQKEETDAENLLKEIKIENEGLVKIEFDDDCVDTDFYEPELKQETEDFNFPEKPKKKRVNHLQKRMTKYEKYTTVTRIRGKFSENISQYYNTVYVSPKVVEKDYKKKGTNRTGKEMAYRCKTCKAAYVRRVDHLRHVTFAHNQHEYPTHCQYCKKEILSDSHLEEHWKTHSPMLRCTLCSDLLRSKGELTKHLNRAHTKKYDCNRCSKNFRTLREFSRHYIREHERATCDYCNKNVVSKKKLEGHIKRNHIPGHCKICKKDYQTYYLLEKHMRNSHATPESEANKETRYCVECDKQYPTVDKYKKHLKQSVVHTPQKKVRCVVERKKESNKETSYCVECDKQYDSVSKYKRHLSESVAHAPRKIIRIPCPVCGKIFSKVAYKNCHYRLFHTNESKHYCELCNKYYSNGFGLRQHIRFVHEKVEKPKDKICDLCGRGFSSNKILVNHRRTHTGERPYKCEYCPAAFAQSYAMKTHQKTQHKNVLMSG